ncbi:MAG: hypothetical protein ACREQ9_26735, partial [Candidatus Binatia bacterium]
STLLDVIRLLNRALGTKLEPLFAEARAGDVRHSLADIRKAARLLGYRVRVPLPEGLARTIEWLRKGAVRPATAAARPRA